MKGIMLFAAIWLLASCAGENIYEKQRQLSYTIRAGNTNNRVVALLGQPTEVSNSIYSDEIWESWEYCYDGLGQYIYNQRCWLDVTFVNGEVYNLYWY